MRTILAAFICLLPLLGPTAASALDNFDTNAFDSALNSAAPSVTEDEFLPVEEAYILNTEFEDRDNQQRLRLNWQIAEGYYLYRHGFNFKLSADGKDLAVTPVIPRGKEKQDEYFGKVEVYYHGIDIYLPALAAQQDLTLAVTSQGCADAGLCYPPRIQYFRLDSTAYSSVEISKPAPRPTPESPSSGREQDSLVYMLLLAMLGGAILNLMPCVFPVLSLKVLGFANDKGHSPVVHGLTYTAGVVTSFVAVAFILVSLQAAGQAIGWGFHLQSPWFVAALCYLFFVMGLSLSGFVEFGGQWMNMGGKLAAQSGYTGSFFTGVLATVVASPCTAPFMGTALGFAVTQPTVIALLVFAALGTGMALPVLALSCSPALLNRIPKPGPWMDTLKQLLAFPLYATAIWLCWVVGKQTGANGMAILLLGLLLIVLAIWFWRDKTLMRCFSAACTALAFALLGSSLLQPAASNPTGADSQIWQAYSPEILKELRAQRKPVFVNITADWCITCLTNEKVTLDTDAVKQSLQNGGVTYLKGDWTNYDPQITALLKEYGRNGIPLYLVYPAGDASRAEVLPQLLTVDRVVKALSSAGKTPSIAGNP